MTSLYNSCFHIHVCLHVICVRKNSRLIDNVFMYNKPYLTSCLVIKSSLELLPLLFCLFLGAKRPLHITLFVCPAVRMYVWYDSYLADRYRSSSEHLFPPILLACLLIIFFFNLHISPILSFIFLPLYYSLSSTHPDFRNPSPESSPVVVMFWVQAPPVLSANPGMSPQIPFPMTLSQKTLLIYIIIKIE